MTQSSSPAAYAAFGKALTAFQPKALGPASPLAVAYSGGADSTALLIACAEKWPGQVRAIHVHHGLQAAADDFEAHCRAACARLDIPLHVQRVNAKALNGASPEDAARNARYKALAETAKALNAGGIALAQHADDQIETLLLALSRGAGLPGLASMPAQWTREGLEWHRPLLDVPGTELRAWLAARHETWVEDPTNADERYTRNKIRARLLPALQDVFPQFRQTFTRSIAHVQQAQRLLEELALEDLAQVGQPPVIKALQALSRDRQSNVLRHWLRHKHCQQASAAQLDELLAQIEACTTRGHRIRLKVGAGHVERQGEILVYL